MSNATPLQMLDLATPIGPIPKDYKHLDELCQQAHITYHDQEMSETVRTSRWEEIEVDGKKAKKKVYDERVTTRSWRDWRVVFDAKLQPKRRKTPTGRVKLDHSMLHRAVTEHTKFCAIIDFIEFRGEMNAKGTGEEGKLDRANVLDVAIGEESELELPDGSKLHLGEKVKDLKNTDWRTVLNECSNMGMSKYQQKTIVQAERVEPKKAPEEPMKQGELPNF